MIPNLKTLRFYIQADTIMNEQVFPHGLGKRSRTRSSEHIW